MATIKRTHPAEVARKRKSTGAADSPLSWALRYAATGWPVLPVHGVKPRTEDVTECTCSGGADCKSAGKHPRTRSGLKDASTDETVIRDWFTRWPDANLGILTGGASGIVVLDVDPRHGGDKSLMELERRYDAMPQTLLALTGGGGRHICFQHPGELTRNSVGKLGPGLDVRADGGYIVVAPSRHASGRPYRWQGDANPVTTELAPLPEWLRLDREERQ